MGLNCVPIQIQNVDCMCELGLPVRCQHRINPSHPLRSNAPRLSVRGTSSERRTPPGWGRRCDFLAPPSSRARSASRVPRSAKGFPIGLLGPRTHLQKDLRSSSVSLFLARLPARPRAFEFVLRGQRHHRELDRPDLEFNAMDQRTSIASRL